MVGMVVVNIALTMGLNIDGGAGATVSIVSNIGVTGHILPDISLILIEKVLYHSGNGTVGVNI